MPLGAELLNVYFTSAKPTPEVAKALEADYRETLLRKADIAVYARRAAAVEEERKIKENELNTDIALEEQRQRLIDLQAENSLREAQARGKALEEEAGYRPRQADGAPGLRRHRAAQGPGPGPERAGPERGRIGNLTITSEILAGLLNAAGGADADGLGGESTARPNR